MKHARPEGPVGALLLSVLASAGLFYVNIMAALVTGLSRGLGIAASTAGIIASANVYGAACGALLAIAIVRRVRWRSAAAGLLAGLMLLDLASMSVHNVPLLIGLRALHGTIGGLLVGISYSVIGRTAAPDRIFGMLLAVQVGLGGFGLWLLPPLVPSLGVWILFAALMLFCLLALLALPFIADPPPLRSGPAAPATGTRHMPLALTFAAIFLFQAGNMGLAAYIIELGHAFGLGDPVIGPTLGIANWVGIAGSLIVYWSGVRFGRRIPIGIGMLLITFGTAAFLRSDIVAIYIAANLGSAILWSFVIPYLLGLATSFDPSGRSATAAGFFSKLGLASGPLLASQIIEPLGYRTLTLVSTGLLALSAIFALGPAALADRLSTRTPQP